MRRRDPRWLVGLVVLGLAVLGVVAAGCSDSGDLVESGGSSTVQLTPIGDPGVDASPFPTGRGTATAAGTDLVVISSTWPPAPVIDAALRSEDGSWWELPSLPFTGFIHLATAGDRAVAGGVACTDSRCEEGELAFAMLSEDHTEWIRLKAPDIPMSVTETELTTSPGPTAFAEFAVGASTYSVSPKGEFVGWTAQPIPGSGGSSYEFGCSSGDTYASMNIQNIDVNDYVKLGYAQEMTGDVYVQPVGGSEQPVSVARVPPGTVSTFGYLCSGNDMLIEHNSTESVFHIDTRTWEITPSNFDSLPSIGVSPISGRLAISADGSTAFLTVCSGPVYRRSSPGQWEDTGAIGCVFATDSQVLVIGEDRIVTAVWP